MATGMRISRAFQRNNIYCTLLRRAPFNITLLFRARIDDLLMPPFKLHDAGIACSAITLTADNILTINGCFAMSMLAIRCHQRACARMAMARRMLRDRSLYKYLVAGAGCDMALAALFVCCIISRWPLPPVAPPAVAITRGGVVTAKNATPAASRGGGGDIIFARTACRIHAGLFDSGATCNITLACDAGGNATGISLYVAVVA